MDIHNNAHVTKSSVEFLVPFTKILVNHLSDPDISFEGFKEEYPNVSHVVALLKKMVRLNQYQ